MHWSWRIPGYAIAWAWATLRRPILPVVISTTFQSSAQASAEASSGTRSPVPVKGLRVCFSLQHALSASFHSELGSFVTCLPGRFHSSTHGRDSENTLRSKGHVLLHSDCQQTSTEARWARQELCWALGFQREKGWSYLPGTQNQIICTCFGTWLLSVHIPVRFINAVRCRHALFLFKTAVVYSIAWI